MTDLRRFLELHRDAVWELPGAVSTVHELTALQHVLDAAGRAPVLIARDVAALDGRRSRFPVVTNLTASR